MEVADDTMRWEAGGAEEEEEDAAADEPRRAAVEEEEEDTPPRYVRDGDLSAAVAALAAAQGAPRAAAQRAVRHVHLVEDQPQSRGLVLGGVVGEYQRLHDAAGLGGGHSDSSQSPSRLKSS
jgi:hypothetical protein